MISPIVMLTVTTGWCTGMQFSNGSPITSTWVKFSAPYASPSSMDLLSAPSKLLKLAPISTALASYPTKILVANMLRFPPFEILPSLGNVKRSLPDVTPPLWGDHSMHRSIQILSHRSYICCESRLHVILSRPSPPPPMLCSRFCWTLE